MASPPVRELDDATLERAAELVAAEHVAARRDRPELPVAYTDPEHCARELRRLLDAGHRGAVATDRGRPVAVMAAVAREVPAIGRYARLPAEALAADPALDDPTPALAAVYAHLATDLLADGVDRHYLLHVARPPLAEALANLGCGRDGVYGVRPVAPAVAGGDSPVSVRVATPDDFEVVADLALVEIRHRSAPPMFAHQAEPTHDELVAEHRALREAGATHLLATVDARVAGLLTLELTTPVPRLCAAGQPYIGPTATHPDARGRGVGHALVTAAVEWAREAGYASLGVDFASANPLSRPFWLGEGFRPTGYGLIRVLRR